MVRLGCGGYKALRRNSSQFWDRGSNVARRCSTLATTSQRPRRPMCGGLAIAAISYTEVPVSTRRKRPLPDNDRADLESTLRVLGRGDGEVVGCGVAGLGGDATQHAGQLRWTAVPGATTGARPAPTTQSCGSRSAGEGARSASVAAGHDGNAKAANGNLHRIARSTPRGQPRHGRTGSDRPRRGSPPIGRGGALPVRHRFDIFPAADALGCLLAASACAPSLTRRATPS